MDLRCPHQHRRSHNYSRADPARNSEQLKLVEVARSTAHSRKVLRWFPSMLEIERNGHVDYCRGGALISAAP